MKILIFRADRVGDFILTSILINSIKKKFNNAEIHIVASLKNYNFIKNSTLVNKVHLLPKEDIVQNYKFLRLLSKTKFDYIIIADGKDRSILISLLIKCNVRIINIRKKPFSILNILKKNKIIFDNEKKFNKIDILKKNLYFLNCKFETSDLNIFENRSNLSYLSKKFINLVQKNFILFHFDEKWILDKYIKSYTSIEPSIEELEKFLNNLNLNSNKDIVITNGLIDNYLFNKLKLNFNKIDDNLYLKQIGNNKIILFDKADLDVLIDIISLSSLVITCHGAPTHIASSFDIKIIDIIERNKQDFYKIYTSHLRNYNKIFRQNFNELTKKISELLT